MKIIAIPAALFLGLQTVMAGCSVQDMGDGSRNTLGTAMLTEFAGVTADSLYDMFFPCFSYVRENSHETYWLLQGQIESLFPLYGYLAGGIQQEAETIFLKETEEGGLSLGILVENDHDDRQPEGENDVEESSLGEYAQEQSMAELLRTENEAAMQMGQEKETVFVPHGLMQQVDLEAMKDYETLIKTFYTVDSSTMAGSDQLNVEKLLARDMSILKNDTGEPQILIYHTHSQEAFADSVPGDRSTSIVGVGDRLTQILTDTYGYQVMHHTGEYDVGSRDDAYARSLPEIEQILEENPSIEVVIDLHRDAMPESTRLVMDLDGRPTARFMFFNGLSRTKKTGNISYLYNANLEDNLAFSFQMEKMAMEYYPGLTRKIYLKSYRYNMHLSPKYLLIELGAQNNTVEEAMNACDPLAHILDLVLSGQ